jgi:hypothetical protein
MGYYKLKFEEAQTKQQPNEREQKKNTNNGRQITTQKN